MMKTRSYRLLGMIAVVLVFATSSIVNYQQSLTTARLAAASVKTGAWATSELESELLKFEKVLLQRGLEKTSSDELLLRFDLLWSRIDTLRFGKENQEVRTKPGALPLLNELHRLLSSIEPRVASLSAGDLLQTGALMAELEPFNARIRKLNVESFVGSKARTQALRSFQNHQGLNLSMLGLLLSGTLLVVMLVRESARNRIQALHDPLTALPNRKFFNEQLEQAQTQAKIERSKAAILVIDLNNFKQINDSLGHDCGDQLLQIIAKRLRSCVRFDETVARLGGDEFAIIQTRGVTSETTTQLARRICDVIGQEVQLNEQRIHPSASIGVSIYPDDGDSCRQVMVHADMAMYRAKKDSGVSYRVFEPQMNIAIQRAKRLTEDLKQALQHNRLVLNYQPVVCLNERRIIAVEALLRWHHDEYGYIPPPEVINVAEQSGLARELNEWVIHTGCHQYVAWKNQGLPPISIAVNISPSMYTQHDLVTCLSHALAQTGMPAQQLTVEVTEDTTMRDIETSPDTMNRIKELGVQIALDDFGTGYSSLSHLKCLPIDKLKIDRSFVSDLNNLPKDLRFIRSILNLAQSLEIEVVAEGIELEQNLVDLRDEGCQLGQGFLFSRAVDADQIAEMLAAQQRDKPGLQCLNFGSHSCVANRRTH